jgi:hypothetical protein
VIGKSALRVAFQLLGAVLVGRDSIAAPFHYLFDARQDNSLHEKKEQAERKCQPCELRPESGRVQRRKCL